MIADLWWAAVFPWCALAFLAGLLVGSAWTWDGKGVPRGGYQPQGGPSKPPPPPNMRSSVQPPERRQ